MSLVSNILRYLDIYAALWKTSVTREMSFENKIGKYCVIETRRI